MSDLTAQPPVRLSTGLQPGPVETVPTQLAVGPVAVAVPGPPGGECLLVIGDTEPTPTTGEAALWLDTSGGAVTLNLVIGD